MAFVNAINSIDYITDIRQFGSDNDLSYPLSDIVRSLDLGDINVRKYITPTNIVTQDIEVDGNLVETPLVSHRGVNELMSHVRNCKIDYIRHESGSRTKYCPTIGAIKFINNICKSFPGETMKLYHSVGIHSVSLYMPEYNIVIDIDDDCVANNINDAMFRRKTISDKLSNGTYIWLSENDNVFHVIGQINTAIRYHRLRLTCD